MSQLPQPPPVYSLEWANQNNRLLQLKLGQLATLDQRVYVLESATYTASRAIVSGANGALTASTTTAVEIGYLSGVTSAVQAQINGKQPLASALTTWAAVTRASGFDTFTATPSSANLRALLTDETGTGLAYFQGGALGTPSSGTLTNCAGLPAAGVTGLGTMATQNANAVAITGGAIDGTVIGGTTRAAGAFTTLGVGTAVDAGSELQMNSGGGSLFRIDFNRASFASIYAAMTHFGDSGGTTFLNINSSSDRGFTWQSGTSYAGRSTIMRHNGSAFSVTGAISATTTVRTGSYTVAGLPAGAAGMRAFVTDANATTFASVVTGGGANGVPVFHDGANWRIG